jgi:CheY-like chemotaxis protein
LSQPHAIIIEDNSRNVQVLANLLTKEGVTHTDILDATQVADTLPTLDRVDVVFLDLEMTNLNGYDILDLFKADDRFQTVPVVAYTVHVSEINTAFEQGFHSFLSKPLDSDRFPTQLASILRGERVWGQG